MNELAIVHGKILTPFTTIDDGVVLIRDRDIISVEEMANAVIPASARVIDARGLFVAPGFIDAHTHGGNGYDYLTASPEQLYNLLLWLASTGVTAVLPTLATAGQGELLAMVQSLEEVRKTGPLGAEIVGIHLEGPYINPKRSGAQPESPIRLPSIPEMEALIAASSRGIKLVTLAPELPGAIELIGFLSSHGIISSLGHSDATYRSEEHTSELQSPTNLVCRLLLEKKKKHIVLPDYGDQQAAQQSSKQRTHAP